jgi:hypothetical protein
MTRPFRKLSLLFLVCMSVLGGALLLTHARHLKRAQNLETPVTEQHQDLAPVW